MKKTTDEKIDDLSKSLTRRFDEKFEELGAMIAHGFAEMREDMLQMGDRMRKVEKILDKNSKESEKTQRSLDKRIVILERFQNI